MIRHIIPYSKTLPRNFFVINIPSLSNLNTIYYICLISVVIAIISNTKN